jgi:hypothetical protein
LYISCAWKNAHGLGYIYSFPYKTWPKARYQKIPKTFSYHSRTITNLTNILHCPEQPWKSHTWIFSDHLPYSRSRCLVMWQREVKLCNVSNGARVVGKCLRNILILCFWSVCVWKWRNVPKTVRKKYKTFSTEWIVALRSVNKNFPQSYDFAARFVPSLVKIGPVDLEKIFKRPHPIFTFLLLFPLWWGPGPLIPSPENNLY